MTQGITVNPWAEKARSLDRYRWALLRKRHWWLGCALRFAREAMVDWWFGLRAKRRMAVSITIEPCDFLLLQSAPKIIAMQRKKLLMQGLRSRGHTLVETALQTPNTILRERLLSRPSGAVPTRYFGHAAHAQWLVDHYQPRILLNDRNGSLYVPFIRLALNARSAVLVHLAHATTVESSRRLGMNDYDYYFLFGQSSLESLQARALRFGSSTAVLAGSHMIDNSYDLLPADPSLRTLLVLGVGPDREKKDGFQAAYRLLRDWAAVHPEYKVLFKAHPRSQASFWLQAAEKLDHLHVLPRDCALSEALAQASIVVNIMSNAVIEAALARRPLLYINANGKHDVFSQSRFFGNAITSVEGLSDGVSAIEENYDWHLQQAERCADYHLVKGSQGLEHNIYLLEELLYGRPCEGQALGASELATTFNELPK